MARKHSLDEIIGSCVKHNSCRLGMKRLRMPVGGFASPSIYRKFTELSVGAHDR